MTSRKKQFLTGIFFTAISKYLGIVVSLTVTAVLARLITPDEFGAVAIATVLISFIGLLTGLGIAPAIIQHKELDKDDLSNIFSFSVWVSVIFSVIFFLLSPLIARNFGVSSLDLICKLLAINLFFTGVTVVPGALLFREKLFKYIAYRNLSIQIAGGCIAIIVALNGGGIYALVVNPIFSGVFIFLVSYRKFPLKLHICCNMDSVRKIASFSLYQFLFNIINFFSRNLDKLLIGRCMGMELLGYYEKSYRLMMLPLENLTHVIAPVMHPIFSDFQDNISYLSTSYLKIVRLLAFIGFPLSVFLFFTAEEITLLLFGMQWKASVPIFRILSLSVGIQLILSTSGSVFQAANDAKTMFVSGFLSSCLNVLGVMAGVFVFQTLNAIAWCVCITFTINFFQCYFLMYRNTFHMSLIHFVRPLISPLFLSVLLFAILFVCSSFLPEGQLWFNLLLKGGLSFAVCLLYVQVVKEYDIVRKLNEFKTYYLNRLIKKK